MLIRALRWTVDAKSRTFFWTSARRYPACDGITRCGRPRIGRETSVTVSLVPLIPAHRSARVTRFRVHLLTGVAAESPHLPRNAIGDRRAVMGSGGGESLSSLLQGAFEVGHKSIDAGEVAVREHLPHPLGRLCGTALPVVEAGPVVES